MNKIKILSSGLLGTTAMTAFSYLVSDKKNKNFREPVVLSQLANRLIPELEKHDSKLAGWLSHYGVGILFAAAFDQVWNRTRTRPSLASGLVLGALSGLTGLATWKTTFKAHPNPPLKNMRSFLSHLMEAQLVYGLFAAIGRDMLQEDIGR